MKFYIAPIAMLLLLFVPCTDAIAQDAHAHFLSYAYKDSKEKVVVTTDEGKIHKFWNLEDGKHLFTFKEDDPDMNVKMLIYNIQKDVWQERNMDHKFVFQGNFTFNQFFIDGKKVAEKVYRTINHTYYAFHYKTRRIAVKNTKDGASTIMLLSENPSDVTNPVVDTIATVADSTTRIHSIEFSHSGRYLYSSGGSLIDVEARKVVWDDVDWKRKYNYDTYQFAFNNSETQMALVNDKGMNVLDVATGTIVDFIPLPVQFKKYKKLSLYACADMKTFLVTESCYSSKKEDCSKKAWLVKKDQVIELSNPN